MKMILSKKIWSVIFTVLIAFGLFTAFPEQAEAAKMKTVYVLSVRTEIRNGEGSDCSPITKYSYDSNGLLKKSVCDPTTTKYYYNSKNKISKISSRYTGRNATIEKFSYKNGRITSSSNSYYSLTYSYNKANKLKKRTSKTSYGYSDTEKFTYNRKGYIASYTSGSVKTNLKYDSKGNIKSSSYSNRSYTSSRKYTLTYKGGRLVKSVMKYRTNNGSWNKGGSIIYKYKKIQVPAAMVSKVKAQQYELLNPHVGIAVATACA